MRTNGRSLQPLGERVMLHRDWLRQLARTRSAAKRLELLNAANTDQMLTLVEIAANIIASHFRLAPRQHNRLQPYAAHVRRLGRTRTERGARRTVIQKGGNAFLPLLLGPVIAEVARHLLNGS